MSERLIYRFSRDLTDGNESMRPLLGGKGAGLAEMSRIGVPVPPGLTLSTACYAKYVADPAAFKTEVTAELEKALAWLESVTGKTFGAADRDLLLLSVRSGARVSMPGMMDTILNLGLNESTVEQLARQSGNRRFALDSYRRFIQMYGDVVMGVEHHKFEAKLKARRIAEGVVLDSEISIGGLDELCHEYLELIRKSTEHPFPQDPMDQLWGSIEAVFKSWDTPRAVYYRKINGIPNDWGTAVNVQTMVFGNMGEGCATGVCFSRNPSDGTPKLYGEFLTNAQGEDVVAGIRTPHPVSGDDPGSMANLMPEGYAELLETTQKIERHFRDMQDVEFTIEKGTFYMLQTRAGKRTSLAGLRIAQDLVDEGMISEDEALMRISPDAVSQLLASEFDLKAKAASIAGGGLLAKGLNAGPGAATGVIVLHAEHAVELSEKGQRVILVREETSPEDIAGMDCSQGILTQRGGLTSHAAVVARGMGKPCVVGCHAMEVDYEQDQLVFGEKVVKVGEPISIDGLTGEVLVGEIPVQESSIIRSLTHTGEGQTDLAKRFNRLMQWADTKRRLRIRTNADTPQDSELARSLGAEGIGLCRTEHMFFGENRIGAVRRMILSETHEERKRALADLLPLQMEDFFAIFKAMHGLPVTIRLLDPPLHEFLPHEKEQILEMANSMGLEQDALQHRIQGLREANPMLGHRGCRLGLSYPEIYQMQVEAICRAVMRARSEGVDVRAEIMVPLITGRAELQAVKDSIVPILAQNGLQDIPVGTMIETPRAALTAGDIAEVADFFSFGTNDLTQCGLALSRDDSGSFMPLYLEKGIFAEDPFKTLDAAGIGQLVEMAVAAGKATKAQLKVGLCGEHGGDPASIRFISTTKVDYVSCSPYRVPVARLAAAQAEIGNSD